MAERSKAPVQRLADLGSSGSNPGRAKICSFFASFRLIPTLAAECYTTFCTALWLKNVWLVNLGFGLHL